MSKPRSIFAHRQSADMDAMIDRVCGVPLALYHAKVVELQAAIVRRAAGERLSAGGIASVRANFEAFLAKHRQPRASATAHADAAGEDDPVPIHRIGSALEVAVVEIRGALVKGEADWRASCGMVGYHDIEDALARAYADRNTKAILAVIDSPGGEVAGCMELMDAIAETKAERPDIPVGVFIDGLAASGGYALAASLADPGRLWAYDSAIVGNIGVYRIVVDETARHRREGLKVHIAQYPDRKTVGNPARALTDDDASFHDARTREVGEMLIERVARARGVAPEAIVALRGEWRIAGRCEETPLLDGLGRLEHAVEAMEMAAQRSTLQLPATPPTPAKKAPPAKAQHPAPSNAAMAPALAAAPRASASPQTGAPSRRSPSETRPMATATLSRPAAAPRPAALSNSPPDDWRTRSDIRACYREKYPNLPPERSERAFIATGRALLADGGPKQYRSWVASLLEEHPSEASAARAASAARPEIRITTDPARDWHGQEVLRTAYTRRYGFKSTNQRAFLRTAEALIVDGGPKAYADWAWGLLARHAEH